VTDVSARRASAIVIGCLALITVLRLLFGDPGPLYLLPALLAGVWLGIGPAVAAAAAAALLWGITDEGGDSLAGSAIRFAIYAAAGALVGWLAESRERLADQLRRKDLELEELRTIQEALAPTEPPERPALELATCYVPAEHGVSGDFFLVAAAGEDSTVVAIGDVAGRGLEAAKRAWHVRTLLSTTAEVAADPAEMLERANRALIEEVGFAAAFITVACVRFEPSGQVSWALAGHDDPISLEDGDGLRGDGNRGLPLGVADYVGCETSTMTLDAGKGFLLYTDGLTEARRTRNGAQAGLDLFGERRLADLIAGLESSAPAHVVERVQGEVQSFTGGKLGDDLCLIALRAAVAEPNSTEVC
jgi:serine phosphatase RsbU (regulator of sigma subunit)